MDNGPNYEQMMHLFKKWGSDFTCRVLRKLQDRQLSGPTRISGMDKEVDLSAQEAIKEWADELRKGE